MVRSPQRRTRRSGHSALYRPLTRIELQAQRVHNLDDRRKAGVALLAQRFAQPFSGDAGVASQLHHAHAPVKSRRQLWQTGPRLPGLRQCRPESTGRSLRQFASSQRLHRVCPLLVRLR